MNKDQYTSMQTSEYNKIANTLEIAQKLCIGAFEYHEKYPYLQYLLQHYTGKYNTALDFGCGPGRMLKHFTSKFDRVDGADFIPEFLQLAKEYLKDSIKNHNFYLTDGQSCSINTDIQYDFIYSTICLQHICVHEIRYKILQDFYNLLTPSGQCSIQLGYGWNNSNSWFDNNYTVIHTNGQSDVSIPDLYSLEHVIKDIESIGFVVIYDLKTSPHECLNGIYHPQWLFLYLTKQ